MKKEKISFYFFSGLKILYKGVMTAFVIIILFLGILFFPFPQRLKLYSVVSGSMEPTLEKGALVVVVKDPHNDYQVGDIVTIKRGSERETITHRINKKIEKEKKIFFETKGDANDSPDLELATEEDIIGKVVFSIPFLGGIFSFAKTRNGFILFILIPAILVITNELLVLRNHIAHLRKKKE